MSGVPSQHDAHTKNRLCAAIGSTSSIVGQGAINILFDTQAVFVEQAKIESGFTKITFVKCFPDTTGRCIVRHFELGIATVVADFRLANNLDQINVFSRAVSPAGRQSEVAAHCREQQGMPEPPGYVQSILQAKAI